MGSITWWLIVAVVVLMVYIRGRRERLANIEDPFRKEAERNGLAYRMQLAGCILGTAALCWRNHGMPGWMDDVFAILVIAFVVGSILVRRSERRA